jgi:hypothetical protein
MVCRVAPGAVQVLSDYWSLPDRGTSGWLCALGVETNKKTLINAVMAHDSSWEVLFFFSPVAVILSRIQLQSSVPKSDWVHRGPDKCSSASRLAPSTAGPIARQPHRLEVTSAARCRDFGAIVAILACGWMYRFEWPRRERVS